MFVLKKLNPSSSNMIRTILFVSTIMLFAVLLFGILSTSYVHAADSNVSGPPTNISTVATTYVFTIPAAATTSIYTPLALGMFHIDMNNIGDLFNRLFRVALLIGSILAVIMIAVAGLQYMTTDAISGKEEGKKRIENALKGLLMLLGVWLFYSVINPNILNINFILPKTTVAVNTSIKTNNDLLHLSEPIKRITSCSIKGDKAKNIPSCAEVKQKCTNDMYHTQIQTNKDNSSVICTTKANFLDVTKNIIERKVQKDPSIGTIVNFYKSNTNSLFGGLSAWKDECTKNGNKVESLKDTSYVSWARALVCIKPPQNKRSAILKTNTVVKITLAKEVNGVSVNQCGSSGQPSCTAVSNKCIDSGNKSSTYNGAVLCSTNPLALGTYIEKDSFITLLKKSGKAVVQIYNDSGTYTKPINQNKINGWAVQCENNPRNTFTNSGAYGIKTQFTSVGVPKIYACITPITQQSK